MELEEAQDVVANGRMEGVECPCCKRFAKVYRRSINSAMARVLFELFKRDLKDDGAWVKIGKGGLSPLGGDYAKLRWWNLIEPMPTDQKRDDGSGRVGMWRITSTGKAFVFGSISRPKHVFEFDGTPLHPQPVVGGQDFTTFEECLGEKFDYNAIMRAIR